MKRVISLVCLWGACFLPQSPAQAQTAAASKTIRAECAAQNIDKAIAACTAIIDRKGTKRESLASAHFNRGNALAKRGSRRAAITDYNEVIRLQPRNAAAYARRALAHSALLNIKESEADIVIALKLAPQEPSFHAWRGWYFKGHGQQEAAKAEFAKVLQLLEKRRRNGPAEAEAHYLRAEAFAGLDRIEAAVVEYTNAIRARPNYDEAYRDRGIMHNMRGDADKAIADWTEALRIEPNYADVLNQRGLAYANKNSYDLALADFERMLSLNADDERAYHGRGFVLRLRKDFDGAIEDTNKAIRLIPDYAVAYSNRGWAYLGKDAYDRAILDFSKAISLDPKMAGAYDGRAQAYLKLKDYPRAIADSSELIRLAPTVGNYAGRAVAYTKVRDRRAIDDASEMVRLQPDDPHMYELRAGTYSFFKENAKAIEDLTTALRMKPDNAGTYLTRAAVKLNMRNFDGMIEDASAAIKLQPDNAKGYSIRAFGYWQKRELDKARSDADEAVRLAPQIPDGYTRRASIYEAQGNLEHALEDLNAAVRIGPKDYWALVSRGRYFYDRSQYDRAIEDYTAAIALEPDFYFVYTLRGSAYSEQKDYDRALADYDRALRLEPDEASIRSGIADVFSSSGDLGRALSEAEILVQSKPEGSDGFLKRGWVYLGKLEYDKALDDFNQAIRLASAGEPEGFQARGILYRRKGDLQRAITDFDRVIALKPGHGSAYYQRAEAYFPMGDYDRALADLNESIRLQPQPDSTAINLRGVIYTMRHDWEAAIKDFEEAGRLAPEDAIVRANRARTLIELKRIEEAGREIDAALKLGTNRGPVLEVRGTLALASEKYAEAVDSLSEAIQSGVATPRVFTRRGTAYEKQGLRGLALADYRKASELDASNSLQREARVLARERIAALEAAKSGGGKAGGKTYDLGRRVALSIGVSDYDAVTRLPNPRNDAKAMAAMFRRLGFAEVVELIDPTRAQMEEAVKKFGDLASGADWAVVFYAGHGMQVDGRNFLIPKDAALEKASHAQYETLPLDWVMAGAAEAKKLGLVILDSCRNNPFLARMIQDGGSQRALGIGLAAVEPQRGELVAFSTRDGHLAADGDGQHSPYAQALLANIEEPDIDIRLFFGKVRDSVLQLTKRTQEPFTYGSLPGESMFFKVSD